MSKIHSNQSTIEKRYKTPFIYYLKTIDGVYENLEDYNLTMKRKVLIVFNHMIKLSPIVTELFITGRKRNISQSYFKLPKSIRLNTIHYYENTQQKRTQANRMELLIWHLI